MTTPAADGYLASLSDRDRELEIQHQCAAESWRLRLRNSLTDSQTAVNNALSAVDALMSSEVYDVEYAEGCDAPDVRLFLIDAARMLRAASALNGTIS